MLANGPVHSMPQLSGQGPFCFNGGQGQMMQHMATVPQQHLQQQIPCPPMMPPQLQGIQQPYMHQQPQNMQQQPMHYPMPQQAIQQQYQLQQQNQLQQQPQPLQQQPTMMHQQMQQMQQMQQTQALPMQQMQQGQMHQMQASPMQQMQQMPQGQMHQMQASPMQQMQMQHAPMQPMQQVPMQQMSMQHPQMQMQPMPQLQPSQQQLYQQQLQQHQQPQQVCYQQFAQQGQPWCPSTSECTPSQMPQQMPQQGMACSGTVPAVSSTMTMSQGGCCGGFAPCGAGAPSSADASGMWHAAPVSGMTLPDGSFPVEAISPLSSDVASWGHHASSPGSSSTTGVSGVWGSTDSTQTGGDAPLADMPPMSARRGQMQKRGSKAWKIVDPKTGTEVAPTASKRLPIRDPKTGTELFLAKDVPPVPAG